MTVMDGEIAFSPHRRRLPNRRRSETRDIQIRNMQLSASIGFGTDGSPREIFLSGARDGSGMAASLADAGVLISIALQHHILALVLAKSSSRVPNEKGNVQ